MCMSLLLRPTPQTSRRVRTKEAALYIAKSEKALRSLVRLGQIPCYQAGNVWLFDVHDLDKYLDSQKPTEYPTPSCTNHLGERN